jgi:hypothetical protein
MVGAVFGAFAGGMAGGLLTLRPDHALVIRQIRSALKQGRWAVVVHPRDGGRADAACATLQAAGAAPLRSL